MHLMQKKFQTVTAALPVSMHQHKLYDSNQIPTNFISMHQGGALLPQSGTSGRVDLRQCLPYCLQPSQEPGMLCRPQHVSTLLFAYLTTMIRIVLLYCHTKVLRLTHAA